MQQLRTSLESHERTIKQLQGRCQQLEAENKVFSLFKIKFLKFILEHFGIKRWMATKGYNVEKVWSKN